MKYIWSKEKIYYKEIMDDSTFNSILIALLSPENETRTQAEVSNLSKSIVCSKVLKKCVQKKI